MSASLVGSEMCIRDRPRTSPSSRRSRTSPSGRSSPRRRWRWQASGRPPPVSYTHLTLPTICSV
eukprot:12767965-Alexandrium_andersonii.AAC.1